MIDFFLWLSDRLELSIPLTTAVVVVAALGTRAWRRKRRERETLKLKAGKNSQQQVIQGNRVGGDLDVKQSKS